MLRNRQIFVLFFVLAAMIFALPTYSLAQDSASSDEIVIMQIEVLNTYPHDTAAYTQGLVFFEDELYESTGNCCPSYSLESDLRRVEIETGEVLQSVTQDPSIFSEGLALVEDRLIQITWRENIAFVYDLETFELVESFEYDTEGWGLCYDGEALYMSDGSDLIYQRDPETFEVLDELTVTFDGISVTQINELECVDDYIYANVWREDFILQIEKSTGDVVGIVDARGLLEGAGLDEDEAAVIEEGRDVLNGIAYNPETETFYITGKRWPRLFEVNFIPVETIEGNTD